MATFDLKTFLELKGLGQGSLVAIESAFGMPSCMINLTNNVIRMLPAPLLRDIKRMSFQARGRADEGLKRLFKKVMLETGIIEFDTEDGNYRFLSDSSKFGMDLADTKRATGVASILKAIDKAASEAGQLYRNADDRDWETDKNR